MLKALIVEREQQTREFLCRILRPKGFTFIFELNRTMTLAEIALERPNLLVVNVGLTDLDFPNFLRVANACSSDTRLLMISQDYEMKNEKLTVPHWITMPFVWDSVAHQVENCLEVEASKLSQIQITMLTKFEKISRPLVWHSWKRVGAA